jgi:hypothetical protein
MRSTRNTGSQKNDRDRRRNMGNRSESTNKKKENKAVSDL